MAAGILGPTPLKVKFVPGHSFIGDSDPLSLVRKSPYSLRQHPICFVWFTHPNSITKNGTMATTVPTLGFAVTPAQLLPGRSRSHGRTQSPR